MTAPVLGKAQLLTGSLTAADQFKVIDPLTFEVTLPEARQARFAQLRHHLSNHFQFQVAKANATADDPWAIGWLREHTAGSGRICDRELQASEQVNNEAQRGLESRYGGEVGVLQTGDRADRAGSPRPAPIWSSVAIADITVDLQASDVQSLESKGTLKVISTPQYNAVTFISMNNTIPPFDNRQRAPRNCLCAAL